MAVTYQNAVIIEQWNCMLWIFLKSKPILVFHQKLFKLRMRLWKLPQWMMDICARSQSNQCFLIQNKFLFRLHTLKRLGMVGLKYCSIKLVFQTYFFLIKNWIATIQQKSKSFWGSFNTESIEWRLIVFIGSSSINLLFLLCYNNGVQGTIDLVVFVKNYLEHKYSAGWK